MEPFLLILVQVSYLILIFFQYLIIVWVVASWLVMFQILSPVGWIYQRLTQGVAPILRPFRWARIGMLDLSPIVAILALDFLLRAMISANFS